MLRVTCQASVPDNTRAGDVAFQCFAEALASTQWRHLDVVEIAGVSRHYGMRDDQLLQQHSFIWTKVL